jgi:hypothetical protein
MNESSGGNGAEFAINLDAPRFLTGAWPGSVRERTNSGEIPLYFAARCIPEVDSFEYVPRQEVAGIGLHGHNDEEGGGNPRARRLRRHNQRPS